MEFEVKESVELVDGPHEGVIVAIEYRSSPHAYTDVVIECDGVRVSASYPSDVSAKTGLGKLILRFGAELCVGAKVDPARVLVGKTCKFVSASKNNYPFVERESLMPLVSLSPVVSQ